MDQQTRLMGLVFVGVCAISTYAIWRKMKKIDKEYESMINTRKLINMRWDDFNKIYSGIIDVESMKW